MKYAWRFTPVAHGLERRDVSAALFTLAILGVSLIAATRWPAVNEGFGPDWECAKVGGAGPVCIRKPAPGPK